MCSSSGGQNCITQPLVSSHLHVSSTCVHHQEVKIALHSLWYHHTNMFRAHVLIIRRSKLHYTASGIITPTSFEHMCSSSGGQNCITQPLVSSHLHVSSTCAHHQEVKIALHSLWYHHTYRWSYGVMIPEAV